MQDRSVESDFMHADFLRETCYFSWKLMEIFWKAFLKVPSLFAFFSELILTLNFSFC